MASGLVLASPRLGCSLLQGDGYRGNLLVVARGECSFATKAHFAERAGAVGLIVTQNSLFPPFAMNWDQMDQMMYAEPEIPLVMISQIAGAELRGLHDQCALSSSTRERDSTLLQWHTIDGTPPPALPAGLWAGQQQDLPASQQADCVHLNMSTNGAFSGYSTECNSTNQQVQIQGAFDATDLVGYDIDLVVSMWGSQKFDPPVRLMGMGRWRAGLTGIIFVSLECARDEWCQEGWLRPTTFNGGADGKLLHWHLQQRGDDFKGNYSVDFVKK